jgi:hypothetical protein
MMQAHHNRGLERRGHSVSRIRFGPRRPGFGVIPLLTSLLALLVVAGCPQAQTTAASRELIEARDSLRQARQAELAMRDELARKDEQIAALQRLGPQKRLERLFTVNRIRLGPYCSGVDMDGKPGDDGVKAYIEPLDARGSAIKAAGEVSIQLYDLAAPPAETLIAACRFSPEDLANKWTTGLLSQHFSLECSWGKNVPAHSQLTLRAVFTDYLTGRSFSDQKVVNVTLPPTPSTQPATAPVDH